VGASVVDGLWFRIGLATLLAVGAIAMSGVLDLTSPPPTALPSTGASNGGGPVATTAQTPTTSGELRHTVVAGDTLIDLADHYYGDESLWPSILAANADRVSDPDNLQVGTILLIPER